MPHQHEPSSSVAPDSDDAAIQTECPYTIRKEHFRHEVAIKQIAWLNIIGGAFFVAIGVLAVVAAYNRYETQPGEPANITMALVGLVGGGAGLWIGIALRQLKPWARIAMSILYVPNLLLIPIGTIIAGCILWYLLHKKSRYVCSVEYQNVLAATSEIKWYRRLSRQEHLAAPQHKEALKRAA